MQPKRDLIIIGSNWSDCPSSSRSLFLQLANERRVLWVSQQPTPRPGMLTQRMKRSWRHRLFSTCR